jgi:hypothetical protein
MHAVAPLWSTVDARLGSAARDDARSLVNAEPLSTWEQPPAGAARVSVGAEISRSARRWGACAVLLLVLFGTLVRVRTALADPNFDAVHPEGMLKSDPGLLYYFTERIIESGGAPPADFRADPRIEHPLVTDVPAMFPVGQEFFVAWLYRWFGGGMPLYVFCVWVMGAFASLCAVGVYGLALELTGRVSGGVFAASLYALMPANYRTIGFILVGEDFSFPWFALHLWLAARAVRLRTPGSVLAAALPLGIALSTWHAASFFVALESACVFAWFVRTGANPFATPAAWILPLVLVAFALAVPVLRHTMFALSLPMQLLIGLLAAAWWTRSGGRSRLGAAAVACLAAAGSGLASVWLSRLLGGGIGEYSHVFGLLWQKLVHVGRLPDDPRELPFEVRLMWQGPFGTLDPAWGLEQLGLAVACLAWAATTVWRAWRDARGDATRSLPPARVVLATLSCVSIPVAWLIERTILLPGILLPVAGACALQRLRGPVRALAIGLVVLVLQAAWFARFLSEHRIAWYRPAQRQTEIAELVRHLSELVPAGEAVLADFMNSTAILAHTRRAIVLQPKYESRRSRERAELFLETFFDGTPEDLRRVMRDEFRCRYVVFDRFTLGILSRYTAGVPPSQVGFTAGTAASTFLSQDDAVLSHVPGFRLLYRSPRSIVQSDGSPTDFFRLYELER